MNRVYEFLKAAGTYYLATVEDGQRRVRPFSTVHIFDNRLYIQTGKGKAVAAQLASNPNAELCAMHKGKWLRLRGVLVEDSRQEAQESMLDAYPVLRKAHLVGL